MSRRRAGRIDKIIAAHVITYSDTGEKVGSIEWIKTNGDVGVTKGSLHSTHIDALFARARREGVPIKRVTF